MSQTTPADVPPAQAMLQLIGGFWVSRALYAAATLGLADLLKDGPRSADALAAATGMKARPMYRLLRALASVGVFRERADGTFELTAVAATLRSDVPDSLRATAMSELGPSHYGAWGEILHSLKTGDPSFDHVHGMPVFEWFGQNPDRAKIFNQSMTEFSTMVEAAVVEAYDFSACGTIVDVGGGHGSFLAGILKKWPSLRGIVYDSPQVVAGAAPLLASAGLTDRCTTAAGDFFQSVPAGGNTYVMKHIIHDWYDDRCQAILGHCRKVMKPGDRVLIVDQVLPGGNEPSIGKFTDLVMMIMPGGMERTAAEFESLVTRAGLRFGRIVPTKSPVCVVEAFA
ncbi:MAG TPA: methyltransferase [Tepidisphaeraceae bacterium]|jgi:hypothetical protein|nr:methyltransferase [Tepidisphaeraceae bacterium]